MHKLRGHFQQETPEANLALSYAKYLAEGRIEAATRSIHTSRAGQRAGDIHSFIPAWLNGEGARGWGGGWGLAGASRFFSASLA